MFEEILDDHKDRLDVTVDTDLTAEDWEAVVADYKAAGRARAGPALPAGPAGAAVGRHRRRLRQLDERPRQVLSPPARHPRKLGHGRQRPGDGVRQHGRDLGHRRRLHPQPLDRREPALRRVPGQRPGRGRGRRHPHAAAADQGRPARRWARQTPRWKRRMPEVFAQLKSTSSSSSNATTATCRTSSSRSSRASSTCCRPATASAPPRRR